MLFLIAALTIFPASLSLNFALREGKVKRAVTCHLQERATGHPLSPHPSPLTRRFLKLHRNAFAKFGVGVRQAQQLQIFLTCQPPFLDDG